MLRDMILLNPRRRNEINFRLNTYCIRCMVVWIPVLKIFIS